MTHAPSDDQRHQIARASRALAVAGLFDHNGHISLRDGEVCYINGRQASRISVRPDQVAVVRIADGARLGEIEPPSETPLHLAVYRARPDVGSVAHFHPPVATSFAVAGRPLEAAFCAGSPFGGPIPVYDEPDLVRRDDQGVALANALGRSKAVLLRGHGVAVCADDVVACLALSVMLEENARRVWIAATLGGVRAFSADEVARVGQSLWQRSVQQKTWDDAVERARMAGVMADLA